MGQAPGVRVHRSGVPFSDPSGVRLRAWMGVSEEEFYDTRRVAIVPMGFCFPGHDAKGGDLPSRRLCAELWRERLFAELHGVRLALVVGKYAHDWHLGAQSRARMSETIEAWRAILERLGIPKYVPLPHPSWRNNAWLKANPWFEAELVPVLRREVRACLDEL